MKPQSKAVKRELQDMQSVSVKQDNSGSFVLLFMASALIVAGLLTGCGVITLY